MLTTMVENWPGYRDGLMGPDLMEEMRAQAERFGAEIVAGRRHRRSICRSGRSTSSLGKTQLLRADALILATGASAKWLDLGVDKKLSGRGVSTCATCDGFFFKGRPIAVVGGGDTAMEEAIYLSKLATQVTVIHRRDTLRASKVMQDKAMSLAERLVHLEHRGHRHQGHRQGRGHVAGAQEHPDRRSAASWPSTASSSPSATSPNTRAVQGPAGQLDENGYLDDARRLAHERARRLRRRRRAGPHLSPGRDRRRLRLHGGD